MSRARQCRADPPPEEGGDCADDSLTVNARLFRQKGYHAATVQEIADAAGLLKGSLYYYYFPSERDILDHSTRQTNDYFTSGHLGRARDV